MSSSLVNVYIGHSELIEYLQQHQNKSFRNFLFQYREVIVAFLISSPVTSCWQDLDNLWARKFLKEAEEFDQISFGVLDEKVRFFYLAKLG